MLILIATVCSQQDDNAEREIVSQTNKIASSTTSHYIFELKAVPEKILRRMTRTHDSLSYVFYREKGKTDWKKFLAGTNEAWNATDVILDTKLPDRRFLYAANIDTKWVVIYEHGGIGSHLHVMYLDLSAPDSITTFVTLQHYEEIHDLIYKKHLPETKDHPFESIVNKSNLKLLNGQLITPLDRYDLF
ncbi:hypothetical protein D4L85_18775 [Chryseolinea soli]|uniref:Uncharacterized protein n=2 Tax=Chryseolinea soli TaxID=2321403 RepID=A0A385SNS8_9BACT|nr:hypothetical protein D4L85_18775 [Chryseolinea soli]